MRGRKPKPTKLKLLHGNPGKRPLPKNEPTPPPSVPTCPTWLGAAAKREWKRAVDLLKELGYLTQIDRAALACYCQAWAEFEWATTTLEKEGRVITTGGQIREDPETDALSFTALQVQPHPAVAQQRSAWKAIKDFAALFGLDPSSRGRLRVPDANPQEDEFESFLRA